MQKHGDEPGYVLAYLDYLSHQTGMLGESPLPCRHYCYTDDNNTRVLYERVLSSMPVDTTQEIWSRFTEFECAVGDLSSVIKVEKRRGNALREVTSS